MLNVLNRFSKTDTPILSYSKSGDVNVMWPCFVYTITLPVYREHRLNIFDETFLKLANLGYRKIEAISYVMSLDLDIVLATQRKLIDRSYVDSNGNILDEGKKYLEERCNITEFVGANIFVEQITGKLLSAVISGGLTKYFVNSGGYSFQKRMDDKSVDVVKLSFLEPTFSKPQIPSKIEVYNAIKAFRKFHSKRSNILKHNEIPDFNGDQNSIGIDTNPSLYYLHIPIVIQESDAEYYAKDPFGFGTSKFFYDEIKNALPRNEKLKEEIIKAMERKGSCKLKENFKNNISKEYRHPINEHYELLSNSYKEYIDSIEKKNVWKEQKSSQDIIKDIYTTLEWALREIFDKYTPDETSLFALKAGTLEGNKSIFLDCAERLGISVGKNDSLLAVNGGKVTSILFDPSKAEMLPLLSLIIFAATINFKHPFRRLSYEISSELFENIRALKFLRDSIQHGSKETRRVKSYDIRKYKSFLEIFLKEMLPEIKLDDTQEAAASSSVIDNRNSLNKKIDLSLQYKMSERLRDELIQLESLHIDNDYSCYSDAICRIYTIAQIALDDIINEIPKIEIQIDKLKNKAIECAKQYFGLECLPDGILKTRIEMIESRMQKGNSTLGATIICFLSCINGKELDLFSKRNPNFINDMDRIIFLRGHGNKTSKMIIDQLSTRDEISQLKEELYNLITSLIKE